VTSFTEIEGSAFPLTMAAEGERIQIVALKGGKQLAMRLTTLGLNIGTEIRIGQKQGGRFVLIRGESRLALGAGMAAKISVVRM